MLRSESIEINALGRNLNLGSLYDARTDCLLPGVSLWSSDDINKHTVVSEKSKTFYSVKASETLSDKMNMLDENVSVKSSFLVGLVKVGGSAKYFEQSTSSSSQCRVTLRYSKTTDHKELNVYELKVLDPEIFTKTEATHVVVEVTYGAEAFLEFEENASDVANKTDIQRKLNAMIKLIPVISLEGEGDVTLNKEDKEKVKNFSCKFYSDFHLEELPATYEDAVKVYKQLPSLAVNPVPVKVWLYPLSKLSNTESKLKTKISESLMSGLEDTLSNFHEAMVRTNTLLERSKAIQAEDIITKLEKFQSLLRDFTKESKNQMAELIPAIRGGFKDENEIREFFQYKDEFGLSEREMQMWLDDKELEIKIVTQYINEIPQYPIKREHPDLQSFLMTPNVSASFVFCFTSLQYEEPYLVKILRLSSPTQKPRVEDPWYKNEGAVKALQDSLDIFKHAPSGRSVISFIQDDKYPGASVRMYHNITLKNPHLTSVKQLFCLTLDPNTASRCLLLSEGNRKATRVSGSQPYPDHPDRFVPGHVMSREPLTGCSYWEGEWNGPNIAIAVAFKSIGRSEPLGRSPKAWSLEYEDGKYRAWHNGASTNLPAPPRGCWTAGVRVDREFGTVSFYWVTSDTRIYLHTFGITHTDEPLHAVIGVWGNSNTSLTLV